MSVNRFSKSAPTEFYFGTVPLQPLMMALQNKQQRFDMGMQAADEIYNVNVNALDADRDEANQMTTGWRNDIQGAIDKYKGDYSMINSDLYKIKRNIVNELSPGGKGYEISQTYKQFEESDKMFREGVMQGLYTGKDYENWKNYHLNSYGGVKWDENNKTWKGLETETMSRYVSAEDVARKAISELVAKEGGSQGSSVGDDGYIYRNGVKWKKLDAATIEQEVRAALSNSQEYMSYASQAAKFSGQEDPDAFVQSEIDRMAKEFGERRSYSHVFTESTITGGGGGGKKKGGSGASGAEVLNMPTYPGPQMNALGAGLNKNAVQDMRSIVEGTYVGPMAGLGATAGLLGGSGLATKGYRFVQGLFSTPPPAPAAAAATPAASAGAGQAATGAGGMVSRVTNAARNMWTNASMNAASRMQAAANMAKVGARIPGVGWGKVAAATAAGLAGFVIGQKADNVIAGMQLVSGDKPDILKPGVGKFVKSLFTASPLDTPLEAANIARAYSEYQDLMSGGGGYNAAIKFVQNQTPEILKPALNNIVTQVETVAKEKGWNDSQKLDALHRGYSTVVGNLSTFNPTYVSLTEGPLGKMARESNVSWAQGGQWHQIMPDGSMKQMKGMPDGFMDDPKLNPPKGMAVGQALGIHYKVGDNDYVVTGTGMSNQIRQAFEPVQQITSVYTTGKPGSVVLPDYVTDASGQIVYENGQPKIEGKMYTGKLDENGRFVVDVENEQGYLGTMNPEMSMTFIDKLYQEGYQKFANFAPSNKDLFGADETSNYYNYSETTENE